MEAEVPAALLNGVDCRIRERVSLAPYTTFRIGGPAALFAEPETAEQIAEIYRRVQQAEIPHFYLGHGSNLLISDEGFPGVVVRPAGELSKLTLNSGIIEAGPAAKLLLLTTFAAHHNLSGMEQLSGIPGSVGGGLYMNAGAYGGEISDTLMDVDVLTSQNELQRYTKDEIHFGYRSAPLLQDKVVLRSRYRLRPGKRDEIFREMRRVWKLRREKQPLDYPSAGSIFKRPPGDYAGRLIEAVNGKGARVGGAMVSPKHAGIFINYEHASASDVAALIREIRQRVYNQFGILLENEVKPVGFQNDPFEIES